jgi:GNAT superfamily N-acetyltransferase
MAAVVELSAEDASRRLGALAEVLLDSVRGGASVGYMADISRADAEAFWRETIHAVAAGKTLLFAAFDGETLIGTVLFSPCFKPNQPHRADVSKLLVLSRARRAGVATALMQALEERALALGRTLLTLDTATDSGAEDFYRRRGYQRAGIIPGYTLMPDGSMNGTSVYYKQLG